ncbi:c-type cytochrome [Stappia sp. GBMRC 2046]|uniref:C-type cytochrome n=1 Tax=Stappia sediminis TaxID=2692190 RepID=A0A7X3LXC5_9HYPH|nr:cytochrome c family protein [Stappia sediminis]MXN66830.1 c-type cytochrome [Stappia sediminis]
MDSFELNKIAGAVLLSLLVVMGLGVVSDLIFETNPPEIPGYEIAVATDHEGGEAQASAEPDVVPIGTRLVEASAESGEKAAKKCAACHSFEQGGPNKVGPALWGVVGRAPGSHEGFGYSGGMSEFASSHDAWSYEELDHFLTNPRGYIDGTTMSFAGIKKPAERADVIAYLRSLSENPEPLPTE